MTNAEDKKKIKEIVSLIVEEALQKEEAPGRLRDIFINPTKDVINTAGYAIERISAAAQKTLKGLMLMIPTLLIPGLEFRYDLFAKDEQERLDAIKKKYGDTLANNWEALKDPDVFGFMFLAYPEAMLGFSALKKSPLALLNVLEVVTGGYEPVRVLRQNLASTSAYTPRKTRHTDPNARNFGQAGDGGTMMGDYYGDYGGTGLAEQGQTQPQTQPQTQAQPQGQPQNPPANNQPNNQVQALLQDPQIKQLVAQSPVIKDMKAQAVAILVGPVANFARTKSVEDVKSFVKPETVEKIKTSMEADAGYKKLSKEEQLAVNQQVFKTIKETYKSEYVKWISNLAKQRPEIAPVVNAAIEKIKTIK